MKTNFWLFVGNASLSYALMREVLDPKSQATFIFGREWTAFVAGSMFVFAIANGERYLRQLYNKFLKKS